MKRGSLPHLRALEAAGPDRRRANRLEGGLKSPAHHRCSHAHPGRLPVMMSSPADAVRPYLKLWPIGLDTTDQELLSLGPSHVSQ